MPETTSAAFRVDFAHLRVHASSRDEALAAAAALLAERSAGASARAIHAGLAERDRAASTAWGNGVAVPHARLAGLSRPVVGLVRLEQPVDFGAPDGKPVDLLVAVLSSQSDPGEHIRILARIARRLRDLQVVATLRGTGDPALASAVLEAE